jgi:hypothetical protein
MARDWQSSGLMTDVRAQRWGAVSGLASLVCGIAGGALERGWPSAADPEAVSSFVAEKRPEILGQSMLFVLSASACAQAAPWSGTVIRSGPLAPTGWIGFVLYPALAAWLLPTAVLVIRRYGHAAQRT